MIDVYPSSPQVYLAVAPALRYSLSKLTFNHDRVYLELRRKGCEGTLIATYNVWRRDLYGNIGFFFDDTFFGQPAGYYIGDVYINCTYCFSVQLRLSGCDATVLDCYTEKALELCGGGECSVIQVIGAGAIGGTGCLVTSDCGVVAPYFPLDNPISPLPVSSTNCQFTACAVGSVIG